MTNGREPESTETILLVDDEEKVREVDKEMLVELEEVMVVHITVVVVVVVVQ